MYQADWLLRFYQFDVTEIIDEEHPFLDPELDPKANWALNHLDFFPVEVNKAPFDALLRVPGIGVRGAKLIVKARRGRALGRAGAAQAGHRLQAGTLLHHVRRGATRAKARTSRARDCARSWPRPSREGVMAGAPTRSARAS